MARRSELSRFASFCKTLTTSAGKPMVLAPFQRRMLADYFAGVRELVCILPKKNGKTTLLAALALWHLLETEDADCVVAANSALQAMKLFDEARGFVQRSEDLQSKLRVLRGYREIRKRDPEDPDNPKAFIGQIKVLAADADTADGWGGTLALVDELHRQRDSELYGVLFDGLGPRAGQIVTISTAGDDEDGPLGVLRARAYRIPGMVRKGAHRYVTSGSFSLHEWALEPTDDLKNLRVVKRANPAPWMSLKSLRERRDSPSMTDKQWARFACGLWGMGGEPAFDRMAWALLEDAGEIPAGAAVTLGFDGARRRDGTALVACEIATGRLELIGYWQRPADADDEWEVPEDEVTQAVEEAFERFDVWRLYGDPPYWETALDDWAGEFGSERVVRWWTNRIKATALALRAFKTDMRPGAMRHSGDPILALHIAQAIRHETRMRADDADEDEWLWVIRKDSRKSPRKIDAAMAAMLAWKARGDALRAGAGQPKRKIRQASW